MITPFEVRSNGLLPIFRSTKKWTITCGKCKRTWIQRVIVATVCAADCPYCHEANSWNLPDFFDYYNKQEGNR